jgi:hypothetical protein
MGGAIKVLGHETDEERIADLENRTDALQIGFLGLLWQAIMCVRSLTESGSAIL